MATAAGAGIKAIQEVARLAFEKDTHCDLSNSRRVVEHDRNVAAWPRRLGVSVVSLCFSLFQPMKVGGDGERQPIE